MECLVPKKVNQDKKAYAAFKDIDKTIPLTHFLNNNRMHSLVTNVLARIILTRTK